MTPEDSVHIRVDYDEALQAERGILFSEMASLRISKIINHYHLLRIEELKLKNRAYLRMKETKANLRKLQAMFPVPKMPGILKRGQIHVSQNAAKIAARQPNTGTGDIESQLREIQRKLDALSR